MDGVQLFPAHRSGEHGEQIRTVHGEVRIAVALQRGLAQIERLPGLARVPEADFLRGGFARKRLQRLADAKLVEDSRAVRAELQPGADFPERRRLLVDLDVAAALERRQGRGESAYPRAGD
jgi:hypothetical protein